MRACVRACVRFVVPVCMCAGDRQIGVIDAITKVKADYIRYRVS